ncbi:hypothetical protein FRB96_003901 [Tulasnella sp. 330]|nr:hypothetical protein FRB96_003901 [Tulasnella sp. 330]
MQWAADPSGANKHCLCLLGMAGSGKSAIAATVADRAKESQQLGARFHFTRDEQERNKSAILVLARQLAYWRDRCLRVEIASALEEERDMAQMTLEVQYKKLIQEPLESLEGTLSALVIVLDALDECDANYAKKLLGLVGKGLAKLSTGVKFFITSRAEPHLQFYFNSEPMKSRRDVYTLGDEKVTELVNGDVEVYFKQKLPELVGPLLAEPSPDWPGEEKRRALVMKAQGLFLWATTATRIIADSNMDRDPEKQLELLLSSTHEDHLDGLYGQIFEHACPGGAGRRASTNKRFTLGSLLSPDNSKRKELTENIHRNVLKYLQAVLLIPGTETSEPTTDAEPIWFIHTSFTDYLTDASRCDHRYLINMYEHHEQLAISCLHQMEDLKRNMCDLDPSILNSEVKDLKQRVQDCMSPGLRYACVHMPAHVSYACADSAMLKGLVENFAGSQLMFWVEGLSLMGKTYESVGMIMMIEEWLKRRTPHAERPASRPDLPPQMAHLTSVFARLVPENNPPYTTSGAITPQTITNVNRFIAGILKIVPNSAFTPPEPAFTETENITLTLFRDLRRFVMEFMDLIKDCSLHVYDSALAFTPSNTDLSRVYGCLAGKGLKIIRGRAKGWSRLLWTASKHRGSITGVAVSSNNKIVVSGSEDKTIRLWDATSGAAVGEVMASHTDEVTCVAVTPDCKIIVSGSMDKTLQRWDATSGAAIGEAMIGHGGGIVCVIVSPDSKTIISGSLDHALRLWDAISGAAVGQVMIGHHKGITCAVISPDGKTIISGSSDHTLRLWDATSGAAVGVVMTGHTDEIVCVAVSPDNKVIVSGSLDKTLRLWGATSGVAVGEVMAGHTERVRSVAVSPDSKIIISGSYDKTLRLWDATRGAAIGKVMTGHTDQITRVAVFPDNKMIVSGSVDNTLRLWDATSGTAVGDIMTGHAHLITCVAVSPDSKTIVSGSNDNTIRLWDATSRAAVETVMASHTRRVSCITVLPDRQTMVSGSKDRTLRLWDATTGVAIGEITTSHTLSITCVAVSPDSKTIVSGSNDTTLHLWDATSRAAIGEAMTGHTSQINDIAVSPDGKTIVSGSHDKTLRRWDAASGAAIGEAMVGHTEVVLCLAISPDNKTIASGSLDRTLRLWDATKGSAVGEVKCALTFRSLAFSSDSKFIISEEYRSGRESSGPNVSAEDGVEDNSSRVNGSRRVMDGEENEANRVVTIVRSVNGLVRVRTEDVPSSILPNSQASSFKLEHDGWLRGPQGKRIFWVPVDFRMEKIRFECLVMVGSTLAISGPKQVPMFDVSAFM